MDMRTFPGHREWTEAFFVILLAVAAPASADQSRIGSIKTYKPEATIVHRGAEHPAAPGGHIYRGDTIVTRFEGAVGITFMDGTVLSLGPETRFTVDDFLFKPAERDVSFLSTILSGTATFISGAIGRISPESVRIKTPTATLGLRGTKILVEVR
jgi:hypothetical protein